MEKGFQRESGHKILMQLQSDRAAENAASACLIGHQRRVVDILEWELKNLNTMPSELQAALGTAVGKVCCLHLVFKLI